MCWASACTCRKRWARKPRSPERIRNSSGGRFRLELGRFLRTAGGVAVAIAVGSGASEAAAREDQKFVAERPASEKAFEDFAGAGGIARLRRQRRARDVRGHSVVGHRPPRMVARRRLWEPYVACVAGELAALQRGGD